MTCKCIKCWLSVPQVRLAFLRLVVIRLLAGEDSLVDLDQSIAAMYRAKISAVRHYHFVKDEEAICTSNTTIVSSAIPSYSPTPAAS